MWGAIIGIGASLVGSALAGDAAGDAADAQAALNAKQAAENAKISREDARVARETAKNITQAGNHDLAIRVNQLKRLKAQTKAGYASRGVAVNTGSALNQQQATTDAVIKDMNTVARNTRSQQQKALSAADRYEMLAEAGLRGAADQAAAYQEAASAQKQNIWASGIMNAAGSIASYYGGGSSSGSGAFFADGSAAPTGYYWGAH
jgi:hypothetical protein